MEILNIHARALKAPGIDPEALAGIQRPIGLITTAQYIAYLKEISERIEGSVIGGQVLGCNTRAAEKIKDKINSFLYIGTGKFHPLAVALNTGKPTYMYNPLSGEATQISEEEIVRYKRQRKAALAAYLGSESVGIIVSTKPGQNRLKEAIGLKRKLKGKKKSYVFISETINPSEFENHRHLGCLINTACPRMTEDEYPLPIVNIDEILPYV